MKTVLCYGDSNTWGCKPIRAPGVIERYPHGVRWTGVMSRTLGEDYQVIEEGLNARTTVHDDPIEGAHKNGKSYLLPCLETHLPLDLVIFMLGTNDLKSRFSLSAYDIGSGIKPLLEITKSIAPKNLGNEPKTLVISPAPFAPLDLFADMFGDGAEKSNYLAGHMEAVARMSGSYFLDAGKTITSSEADGFHLDLDQHLLLGEKIAETVHLIFSDG